MDKKIIIQKNEYGYFPVAAGVASGKKNIGLLYESFNLQHDWIVIEKGTDEVIIWDSWGREDYPTEDHIPKLIMTRKSYDNVIAVWNLNVDNPKKYLVLTQQEDGLITLEAKDELSEQDLLAVKEDRQAGKEWEENWKKQMDDYWFKKKWRNLKYKFSRSWLSFRQWLQV